MLAIILDGAIKSKRIQNAELVTSLYNGDDYISVDAWDDNIDKNSSDYYLSSSFPRFILGLPCFTILVDVPAIKCEKPKGSSYDYTKERVSQYLDEWHVKDKIDLEKVVGISLSKEQYINEDKKTTTKNLECVKAYNWEVFISDDNLVELVRECFKKVKNNSK